MKKAFNRLLCFLLPLVLMLSAFSVPTLADAQRQSNETKKVELLGLQRSLESDDTYALRFVAGISSEDCTDLGMVIIIRTSTGKVQRIKTKNAQQLSAIKETVDGVTRTISADELGVAMLYTAVIDGIPKDLESITLEITPYCSVSGESVEGTEKIIIFEGDQMITRTEYALAEHKDKIKIYGRSLGITSGIACDFSAAGIEFNITAHGDVNLKVNSNGTSYYALYIDGERQEKRLEFTSGTEVYTIAEDLPAGEYNFKLIKQNQISISTIISLDICGVLLSRPADKDLLIEFVGDSITCGYALIEDYDPANAGSAMYMDATKSYAYLTAEKLDADHSLVCRSGWALLENASGNESVAKNIYPYTSYVRGTEKYTPSSKADIVVIHLGTNDVSWRNNYGTDFVEAGKTFIGNIREMNPGAKIVWAYGSMVNSADFKAKINDIIGDLGGASAGLYSVELPYDRSGGNTHPTAPTHVQSAEILAEFIQSID